MSANASKKHQVRMLLHKVRSQCMLCRPLADEALALLPGTRPETAPNDHAFVVDLFCRIWNEVRGSRYAVQGAKDGAAVKRLLAVEQNRGEIERRMRVAFQDPFFLKAGSIAFFVAHWNQYDGFGRTQGTAAKIKGRLL